MTLEGSPSAATCVELVIQSFVSDPDASGIFSETHENYAGGYAGGNWSNNNRNVQSKNVTRLSANGRDGGGRSFSWDKRLADALC